MIRKRIPRFLTSEDCTQPLLPSASIELPLVGLLALSLLIIVRPSSAESHPFFIASTSAH